jgi:hypothetical protein
MSEPTLIPDAGDAAGDELLATECAATPSTPSAEPSVEPLAAVEAAPEVDALLEIIRRGLASNADASARSAARDVCQRVLQVVPPLAAAPTPTPTSSLPPVMPAPLRAIPPSPIGAVVGTLRNLPPEQLLDLAIQRLRAALPTGTAIAEPRGVQFQLVPVAPIGGKP